MEAIITVVGFLGSGKTTLLRHLINSYVNKGYNPFVVLNDYENANLEAQQFLDQLDSKHVRALSGSWICSSGIDELRECVNRVPQRANGITLIEANGTSDACSLMSFLGVGLNERFLPPIQISVVDVKNWQTRDDNNDLEVNQIQVSSLIVLTHIENISEQRKNFVIKELNKFNPTAEILNMNEIDVTLLPKLLPSKNKFQKFDHLKAHWSSCSIDLPNLPHTSYIYDICNALPMTIMRIKGCTQIGDKKEFIYFERTPNGKVSIRPFNGVPITGSKLLTIGPGSEPSLLKKVIKNSLS